uniref:ABC1 atypical kinase-like domain-containing protein n=1 Tax=Anas platyrhynchos platyrhynchos TaxID=8840 RepID=A0A493TJR5_ANAPP
DLGFGVSVVPRLGWALGFGIWALWGSDWGEIWDLGPPRCCAWGCDLGFGIWDLGSRCHNWGGIWGLCGATFGVGFRIWDLGSQCCVRGFRIWDFCLCGAAIGAKFGIWGLLAAALGAELWDLGFGVPVPRSGVLGFCPPPDPAALPPQLRRALERARQGADFMPSSQTSRVLAAELGSGWRGRLGAFEELPFAAASIGQVHRAALPDGTPLAIKVQYPGVARSIGSDVANLLALLKVTPGLPEGEVGILG